MPGDPPLTILVTGFKPYDDDTWNITEAVVNKLQLANPNVILVKQVLDSDYRNAESELKRLVAEEKPDFIIALGESNLNDASGVSIETKATNYSAYPDRFKNVAEPLDPDDARHQTILCHNAQLINTVIRGYQHHRTDAGSGQYSTQAGGYLCNDIFYRALKLQDQEGRRGQAMFIHLNDLSALQKEVSPISRVVDGYVAMLEDTIDYLETQRGKSMQDIVYEDSPEPVATEIVAHYNLTDFKPAEFPRFHCKNISADDMMSPNIPAENTPGLIVR